MLSSVFDSFFPGFSIDGLDIMPIYEATKEAIKHAREQGPVLLEMNVERLMPHTTDDDDRRYRSDEELEAARKRDPVASFTSLLIDQRILDQEKVDAIHAEALSAVDLATDAADAAGDPDQSALADWVYAP